jgi:hypothetical protein
MIAYATIAPAIGRGNPINHIAVGAILPLE